MSEPARPALRPIPCVTWPATLLVMIAGFVSFPIMTRLLDNAQYGILGYFDAWLLILVAVFKLGAQHAILRFYPHVSGPGVIERFGANFVLLPFLCGCALWALGLLVYAGIVFIAPPEAATIGWIMLLLLPPTIWISYSGSVAFAQEKSMISAGIAVAQRWLEAGAILCTVYFIDRSARGVYLARLGVGIVFALFLFRWCAVICRCIAATSTCSRARRPALRPADGGERNRVEPALVRRPIDAARTARRLRRGRRLHHRLWTRDQHQQLDVLRAVQRVHAGQRARVRDERRRSRRAHEARRAARGCISRRGDDHGAAFGRRRRAAADGGRVEGAIGAGVPVDRR